MAWDLDNTHYYSLLVLFYLGELKQLEEALPGLLKEAEDRGDLYAVTSMRTRLSYLVRLANDEPERARQELREAIAIWPSDVFRLQHWYEMIGQVESLLYAGTGPAAWRLVGERWPLLQRSFMLRTQSILINSLSFRARAAIAAACDGGGDPQEIEAAEKDARRIERERMPWGNAIATLLQSRRGVGARRENVGGRAPRLRPNAQFTATDMALHAAVARRRRGELLGGSEGAALVAEADAWMTGQGIRSPSRMAAMLAPGTWS